MLSRATRLLGLAIAGCALIAQPASAQWRKIADFVGTDGTVSVSEPVTCVYFLDLPGPPRIGYVGTESELYKTTDGGQTWQHSWDSGWSFAHLYVTDIDFKDSLTGWFALSYGPSGRTTDGGKTWTKIRLPGYNYAYYANAIHYCASTNRLFLCGPSSIYVSTDLGSTWQDSLPYLGYTYSFWSPLQGLVPVSPYPYTTAFYLVTSDGGVTWDTMHPHYPDSLGGGETLAIPGTSICFEADYSQIIIRRSDDYGHTWRRLSEIPSYVDSFGTLIGPSGTGIIRGDLSRLYVQTDSGMYVSVDQGVTWNVDGGPIYSTPFTNDRFYAAKGVTIAGMTYGSGMLTSSSLWEEDWPESGVAEQPCIDSSLSAISVSENPLHEATTLRFELTDAEYVRVEVFDVLGGAARMAAPRAPGALLDAGVHTMPISLTGVPSGTYYLRLTLGTGEVRTIKLVKE